MKNRCSLIGKTCYIPYLLFDVQMRRLFLLDFHFSSQQEGDESGQKYSNASIQEHRLQREVGEGAVVGGGAIGEVAGVSFILKNKNID